ncbi:hypothetical protein LLG95_10365 [bacterium]|nr:hypothetical protein [bacterium]
MNLKFMSRIEPRVAVISVLAIAFVGTLSSMTYGFVLGSRVGRIMTDSASLVEVTSGTTTRVADTITTGTRARDAATSGSTRSIAGATSGTRTTARSAATSATRNAMRMTTGTQSAARLTSGTKTVHAMTSGTRVRLADKSGSRTVAMGPGKDGMMRPGRGPRGGPGGPVPATSTLPTTITQLIEQKGLFGRKPQPPTTVSLQGILGESALINGQWVKIGESQGGIKLLELQPNKAVIEFQGQRRDLTIWQDMPRGG